MTVMTSIWAMEPSDCSPLFLDWLRPEAGLVGGWLWHSAPFAAAPRDQSVMIGDMDSGYMIAPAINSVHERLIADVTKRGAPII